MIEDNQVSDISALQGLTNLVYLNLNDNKISYADVQVLKTALPNCFIQSNPVVNVAGVSLDKTSDTLTVGSTNSLTATVAPTNATNKNVTWTSSNTSIATVDNTGKVTAVSAGTVTITAKTVD